LIKTKTENGIQKVTNDNGEIAVIIHPSFGGGWYSWERKIEMLFHPEIVIWILNGKPKDVKIDVAKILNNEYRDMDYISNLEVVWIKEGEEFRIREYDGSEWVEMKSDTKWITA
jgi:hypothetical protein